MIEFNRKAEDYVLMVNRSPLRGPETIAREEFSVASEEDFYIEEALFEYQRRNEIPAVEPLPGATLELPLRLPGNKCLRVYRRQALFPLNERSRLDEPGIFEGAWDDDVSSLVGLFRYTPLTEEESIPPLRTESGKVLMVDREAWFYWNDEQQKLPVLSVAQPDDIGRKGMVFAYVDFDEYACLVDSTPDPRAVLPLRLPDGRELLEGPSDPLGKHRSLRRIWPLFDYWALYDFSGVLSWYVEDAWRRHGHCTGTLYTYDRFDRDWDQGEEEREFRRKHPIPIYGEIRPWP